MMPPETLEHPDDPATPLSPVVIPQADQPSSSEAEVDVEVEGDRAKTPVEEQGADPAVALLEAPERPEHAADPARRRRMLPWAIAGCALATLGAATIGLSYTPLVAARTVTVTGERHLTQGQVLHIARLGEGANLIHVDLAAAERRLERNPWVAEARVERDLPHTLRIAVVERTPNALTARPDGALAYVATDGTMMGAAVDGSPLPTVVATDGELPAPAEVLQQGAAVAAAMPAGLQQRTDTISVGPDGSIVVETLTHIMVTYGDDSQLEAKGQTLKAVLDWSERAGVPLAAVDVTVPGAPTARRYGAPAESEITLSSRLR
jgi:cell division protein FtsQ